MAKIDSLPEIGQSFNVLAPPFQASKYVRMSEFAAYSSLTTDLSAIRDGGVARIYTPDGDPELFNKTGELVSLLRGVQGKAPTARVQVMTGPVIAGDDEGRNGLLDLARGGLIELYTKPFRGATAGFRLVEVELGFKAVMEFPHSRLTPVSERLVYNLHPDRIGLNEAYNRCIGLVHDFDILVKGGEGVMNPATKQEPLVVPESSLRELVERMERSRIVYQSTERERLKQFIEEGFQVPV